MADASMPDAETLNCGAGADGTRRVAGLGWGSDLDGPPCVGVSCDRGVWRGCVTESATEQGQRKVS